MLNLLFSCCMIPQITGMKQNLRILQQLTKKVIAGAVQVRTYRRPYDTRYGMFLLADKRESAIYIAQYCITATFQHLQFWSPNSWQQIKTKLNGSMGLQSAPVIPIPILYSYTCHYSQLPNCVTLLNGCMIVQCFVIAHCGAYCCYHEFKTAKSTAAT